MLLVIEPPLGEIGAVVDTDDGFFRTDGFGDSGCEQVDFVTAGGCDDQVGGLAPSFGEDFSGCTISAEGADVEGVFDLADSGGAFVDDGDVVGSGFQDFGCMKSHFTGAADNDVHARCVRVRNSSEDFGFAWPP